MDWARAKAEEILGRERMPKGDLPDGHVDSLVVIVAQALREERERCAKMADDYGDELIGEAIRKADDAHP